ncbi:MAG TPA: ABC transporter ATP-binding protein [Bacillota bacterium]|nr:ABC transporter ATP-binding protein [Candidatus Fermentithermobacillaceae bacterium]HOB31055.1 ABC transporter ATP-binding protein [Bacillota bacterium]HOK64892.1 ABC transporter ATP-binding protein [Bacillota bacterium]HOL12439.1 ABC transporter ATP-binding protein [Bacillota bacterium]HOQ03438.1 ABC transporter ATP-binding protein [Bacillota bacterium]
MRRLLRHLKPFTFLVILTLGLVLLQSLSELALPSLMADIVDFGIARGNTEFIWKTGGKMLLVALAGVICSIASSYFSAKISTGFGKELRGEVFTHVTSLRVDDFEEFGTASLITRTTNDISQIQMVVLMLLGIVASAPLMFVGGVIMALSRDRYMAKLLLAIIPVLVVVVVVVSKKVMPMFKEVQQKLDKLNLVLREGLTGVRVIRAFNKIDYEKKRFDEANRDLTETMLRVNRTMAVLMPIVNLSINFLIIGIIWVGSHRIDLGYMEVGGLMAFIQYAMHILMSMIMVSMIFIMLPRAAVSADRINEILDTEPESDIMVVEGGIVTVDARDAKATLRGTIEFRDVTFSYPDAERPTLSNITFTAKPGQMTAILGGTGSGKSTVVNLIPRFFDVDSGQILIDGVDIRDIPLRELRGRIGLVPQQAILFSGTIAENIRYGKPDATDEEVRRAAEIAQALDFIEKLPKGFDSYVAQGGVNFSGGQKQRLCIARAIVRRPDVYIFDDSFSALDFKTDAKLRAALKREVSDAVMIVVAQRVNTILDADLILVMDEGKIVGSGTHKELLKTCQVYREIVLSQVAEEEIA